jgi:methionyl-tRNA formyltransferase
MYMTEKMDAGDIISQEGTEILPSDTVGTLHDRLSIMGRDLLMQTLPLIIEGKINPIKQKEEEITFAWNIKREDEKINFEKSTREIFNKIRGLNPWPGAYTILEGKIIKIWASREGEGIYTDRLHGEIVNIYDDGIGVKTDNGEIVLTEIQVEGKKRMLVSTYLVGLQDKNSLIGKIFE